MKGGGNSEGPAINMIKGRERMSQVPPPLPLNAVLQCNLSNLDHLLDLSLIPKFGRQPRFKGP